ncbi:hypothetical protein BGZ72_007775 [Mortierella alpina]|nr:hypothetical protein BGZ72_007775 [Mortierella alpina]
MADTTPSPCKVSLNGAFRRFLIGRPALWRDFEDKIRVVYSLPPNAVLDVQYKDEEGDVIKLNTDGELDDVLAMHALFSHIAPVKFEVSVSYQDSLPSSTATSTRASSLMGDPLPQLTSSWLNGLNQTYSGLGQVDLSSTITSDTIASPPNRPRYQPSSTYGSDQSDDVSLIELEDSQELRLGNGHHETDSVDNGVLDESISYPQCDIDEALRLHKEMEQLEAYKLDAPVFTSSVLGNTRTTVEDYTDGQSDAGCMEQNHYDHAEDDQVPDTPQAGAVAAAVEHYETLASRSQKCFIDETTPLLGFEAMRIDNDVDVSELSSTAMEQYEQAKQQQAKPAVEQVDPLIPAESSAPSTSTASTSTSDRGPTADDSALIEQFQMLVKEFQDIIQNNPQLVALAGSIMTKILSNVKVNVESFAGYLQTQAQIAAQNAQQAGQQVAAQAQEAASHIQEKAQEVASKVQERATQASGPLSFPPGESSSFPASGGNSIFGQHHRRQHQHPNCNRPSYPHHQGGHPSPFFLHHARRNHFYERAHQHNQNHHHHHHRHRDDGMTPEVLPASNTSFMPAMSLPDMPPVPSTPWTFSPPVAGPALGLGRSNTVHSSRPSPFLRGATLRTAASTADLGRPVVHDIESPFSEEAIDAVKDEKHQDEKGKAVAQEPTLLVDVSGDVSNQSSSSHMPGSFPGQPEMSNIKVGWSWTRLPDDGAEHHQPPSTRAKYGWVWNDVGGEKAEIADDEEPTSLYTHLTEHPAQATPTPGSFPSSLDSQPKIDAFKASFEQNASRGLCRSSSLYVGRGADTQDDDAVEKLRKKRHQAIHTVHHDAQTTASTSHTATVSAGAQENRQQDFAQQKLSIVEQRKAIETQRQFLVQMQRDQAQRVEQMASRARPMSHIGSFPSTPGDFPTVPIVRAPVRARVRAAPPARPAAIVPSPAAPAPPVPAPTPTPTPEVAVSATIRMNPFADPFEFENELRTIVDMGFEDTAELRTVMQDFGGEFEAIVEFLIGQ